MFFILLLLAQQSLAHGGTAAVAASGMMGTFHFTLGDSLWFAGWIPQSKGALTGACIGLFLLAIVDRWLASCRAMLQTQWTRRVRLATKARIDAPPFIPKHDLARGALHALQALLGFAFMLAVMTFQAAFILSVVGGLGVGEMMFGRYAAAALH
ncbi:CTR copper uptake transporter [Mycena belliarum]|uniref:Copper transport protein n=1 Tax=Mycena belliarum TaxID=1033014 RepID=A0AAD6UIY5_9AGAR|nr:CTR copper uptake transporter [Mycena belliae]